MRCSCDNVSTPTIQTRDEYSCATIAVVLAEGDYGYVHCVWGDSGPFMMRCFACSYGENNTELLHR